MSKLQSLIIKSETSAFNKWILNFALSRAVPFNAPHHFKIVKIGKGFASIKLPYRRNNLNHVKGIHACALATLCEYTTGMVMMSLFSNKDYRIILKTLRMEYSYQAKMDVYSSFTISDEMLRKDILNPLTTGDAVFKEFEIAIHDTKQNLICTGFVNWQIKKWNKVKSK